MGFMYFISSYMVVKQSNSYVFNQIGNQKKQTLEEIKKDIEKLDFREYIIKLLDKAEKFERNDPKITELKNKFINQCPQEVRRAV